MLEGVDRHSYSHIEKNWLRDAIELRVYDLESVFEDAQEETTLQFTDTKALPRNAQKIQMRNRNYYRGTNKERLYLVRCNF